MINVQQYVKNYDNLESKREKVEHELLYLKKPDCKVGKIVGISRLESSNYDTSSARELKEYQLSILDWMDDANSEQILHTLQSERKKLCVKCNESLESGDIKCNTDFKQFIYCNMMFQAISMSVI